MKIEPVAYMAEGKLFYKVDFVTKDHLDRPVRIRKRRFKSAAEARKWAAQAALRVQAGEKIARARGRAGSGELRVSEVFARVREHLLKTGKWKPSTAQAVTWWWRRIDEEIGNKLFSRVTRADIERVRRLDENHTGERLLKWFLAVWRHAEKMGIPGPALDKPKAHVPKRSRVNWITREQAAALLQALPDPYRGLTVVLLGSGMRVGEALGLRPEDVDPQNATVTVGRTWSAHLRELSETTKTGRRRIVPVSEEVLAVLLRTGAVDGRIFGAINVRAFRAALAAAGERAGVPIRVHPHLLRHSFASWLLQAGVDVIVVAQLLGHSSIQTTSVYAHSSIDAARSAIARIPNFSLDK